MVVMETAVLRELVGSDRIPTSVVDWLVSGRWPTSILACDVAYPRADYAGLLEF
ncbi:hypothetical protein JHV666_47840 [Mycobacterium avium subsp. hominissuis]